MELISLADLIDADPCLGRPRDDCLAAIAGASGICRARVVRRSFLTLDGPQGSFV